MALLDLANKYTTLRNAMFMALALRIGLIIYGDYHDRHSSLKYTDVDYRVFSDASHFVAHASNNNLAQGFVPRILSWNLGEYVANNSRISLTLSQLCFQSLH
jgi:hypothetical protein